MILEPITLILALSASLISPLLTYLIKGLFNKKEDNKNIKYFVKNSLGEKREFSIISDDVESELKKNITSTIKFENLIKDSISSISPNIYVSKRGSDFILDSKEKKMIVEVESATKPMNIKPIARGIHYANKEKRDIIIVAQGGFTPEAKNFVSSHIKRKSANSSTLSRRNKTPHVALVSGKNKKMMQSQLRQLILKL